VTSVDVLVVGRNTFEKVLSLGAWSYGKMPVIVLSSNDLEIPLELPATVTYSKESPEELCSRLSSEGVESIYVDGSWVIQSFLNAGFISDFIITVIPVIIGRGISLFGDVSRDIELKHVSTQSYEFGFVQNRYSVLYCDSTG
jgi:dihydrofolate reductase